MTMWPHGARCAESGARSSRISAPRRTAAAARMPSAPRIRLRAIHIICQRSCGCTAAWPFVEAWRRAERRNCRIWLASGHGTCRISDRPLRRCGTRAACPRLGVMAFGHARRSDVDDQSPRRLHALATRFFRAVWTGRTTPLPPSRCRPPSFWRCVAAIQAA